MTFTRKVSAPLLSPRPEHLFYTELVDLPAIPRSDGVVRHLREALMAVSPKEVISNLQRGMSRLSAFNPDQLSPRAAEDMITRSDGVGRLRMLLEAISRLQDRRHAIV